MFQSDNYVLGLQHGTQFFDQIIEKVKPLISKHYAIMRSAVPAHDKFCTTMRVLASGELKKDLMYSIRVTTASISKFVPECDRPSMMSYIHEDLFININCTVATVGRSI